MFREDASIEEVVEMTRGRLPVRGFLTHFSPIEERCSGQEHGIAMGCRTAPTPTLSLIAHPE